MKKEWKSERERNKGSCLVIDTNYLILQLILGVFLFYKNKREERNLMDICFFICSGHQFYTGFYMVNFLFYSLEFVTKVSSAILFYIFADPFNVILTMISWTNSLYETKIISFTLPIPLCCVLFFFCTHFRLTWLAAHRKFACIFVFIIENRL